MFADVILPLALPKRSYTYAVPDSLADYVQPGVRVEVPFGPSKLYSGLVERLHDEKPEYRVKSINAVLDEVSVVSPQQLLLWDWISEYYCCTLGEVMAAAMPGHLKLTSETKVVLNPSYGDDFGELDAEEYLVAEALEIQNAVSIDDIRKILNKKTVFPVIQRLLNRGLLFLREDLQEKFRPRMIVAVRLAEPYLSDTDRLRALMTELEKRERQMEVLLAFIHLSRQQPYVRRADLLKKSGVSHSSLNTLVKNGVFELYDREVSRVAGFEDEFAEAGALSEAQQQALREIDAHFQDKNVALLHGVTGSGKTRIYVELIQRIIREGGQVLYLLPEIALTTQIINRLKKVFGGDVAVYHSKINYNERVELWRGAAAGRPVILSARSGLFLPYQNLKLIIVDEEHDSSFKQYDPAPRYHARDTAIYLAGLYGAKVLLGTATPALETYHNAQTGKYGLVELRERFGGMELPEIDTIDLRDQLKTRRMQGIFSSTLLEQLQASLANGEQVILFQNRRGFAPILECQVCGWTAQCQHCDVSLTYHKFSNRLRCHYCGYQQEPVQTCPACGSGKVTLLGFGTEKIEDDLKLALPEARIARLDLDTAGSKTSLGAILSAFEEKELDVLVGTQMVTKGLDFENVGLVGVLGADQLVRFPDFRAGERAYQLLTQVAGRAGRKNKRGRVLMQAFNPTHPVLQEVLRGDFAAHLHRELAERREFQYPPFVRMIQLTLRHKDEKTVQAAAALFARILRGKLGERVLGPVQPPISRLRGFYGQDILLKLEKDARLLARTKALIKATTEILNGEKGFGQVQVAVDVDPV